MKALVYHGPGQQGLGGHCPTLRWFDPTDVVVRVDTTTICGTDLHILQGDVEGRHRRPRPRSRGGRHGHRGGRGRGPASPSATACSSRRSRRAARCPYCQRGHALALPDRRRHRLDLRPPHRRDAGRVRTRALHRHLVVPGYPRASQKSRRSSSPTSLPTGYEVGVLAGNVRPGPHRRGGRGRGRRARRGAHHRAVGRLATVIAVDSNKFRLSKALEFGATDAVEVGPGGPSRTCSPLTDGLGVDVSIEAVGYPQTLQTAAALVRPGGTIANIGVHGVPVELPMQEMWIKNVTLTMGLVDTHVDPDPAHDGRERPGSPPRRWAPTPSAFDEDRARPTRCSATPPPTRRSRS